MPELPEVETVCRGLAQNIIHKHISKVTARRRDLRVPLPANFEKALEKKEITRIARRAKYILIHLDNDAILVIHLGMSGTLILHEKLPKTFRKHDHVIIEFAPDKKSKIGYMVFHDPRRFGLMALTSKTTFAKHKLFVNLGPEPLDKKLNGEYLYTILQSSKAPVKSVIMDQRKLVGVGNIYACEALFRAHIHPERAANKVTQKEATALVVQIKKVLEAAIKSGGSTVRDYVRSSGDSGYFQHHFSVYGRKGLPCLSCKTPVSVIRQSGRSTFFCANCQK